MSFIIKPGDPVYYPSVSNSILETEGCGQDKDILQIKKPSIYLTEDNKLKEVSVTYFMKDGKLKEVHANPSIFPATKEWFDKLKVAFPDLHNPESFYKLQKKELVSEIIDKFGFCHVAREDNFKNLITKVVKQADQLGHYDYHPINPFTLKKIKSIEEYVEMPENHTIYKYCVEVMEHEPGWGSKPDGDLWFKTEEEAKDFVKRKEASASPYASYKYVGLKLYKEG